MDSKGLSQSQLELVYPHSSHFPVFVAQWETDMAGVWFYFLDVAFFPVVEYFELYLCEYNMAMGAVIYPLCTEVAKVGL